MRLTTASEYGCLALLAMAEHEAAWCKRSEISERFPIPSAYLEQILRKLVSAGFVVSRRGADGGFRLSSEPAKVVIADVVRVLDGPLAPVTSVSENYYQPSPVEASPGFHALFRQIRDVVADILENTTLQDIIDHEHRAGTRKGAFGSGARPAARPARRRTTKRS